MTGNPATSLPNCRRYGLVTRKPIDLLSALIDVFKDDAILTLIGDLSQIDFRVIPGAIGVPPLPHSPIRQSVSIVLRPDNKMIIQRSLLPRIGLRKRVWEVQITEENITVFSAYDGFDPDCVWIMATVGESFVQSLIVSKCIWAFYKIE